MNEVMDVLNDNKSLLLTILDIFLKDPLIDWENRVDKTTNLEKHKNKRLKTVERKLNHENPLLILLDELKDRKEYPKGIDRVFFNLFPNRYYVIIKNY